MPVVVATPSSWPRAALALTSAATVGSPGLLTTVAARSGSAWGRAHRVCRPAAVASRVTNGATTGTSGSGPADPPVLAAESVPSTPGSTAQVTGTGPAG